MKPSCPRCGETLKHKMRFSKDKRRKKQKVLYDLEYPHCSYVKPNLEGTQ